MGPGDHPRVDVGDRQTQSWMTVCTWMETEGKSNIEIISMASSFSPLSCIHCSVLIFVAVEPPIDRWIDSS